MIVYHQTETDSGKKVWCATINNTVYVPYHHDKEYVIRRAKYFEEKLKDPEYDVEKECYNLGLSNSAKRQFNIPL